jgi:cyclophilin family peptidyl-prolyl cis-trans isomerase
MADKKVEGSTPSTDFALDTQIKSWATNAVLGLAIVFAGWAVYSFIRGQQEKTVGEEWRTFTRFEASIQDRNATPISMEMVSEAVRPWAMLEDANRDFTQGKVDRSALVETESRFASLAKNPAAGVAASGMVNVGIGAPAVASSIGQLAEWEKANPQLLDNPNPDASPRVKLVTDAGTIEIALYKAMAPKHVENFVKLAQEGLYTGTKFHRVSKDLQHVIEGGDPNTKEENVENWGKGAHGDGIPFEKNRLANVRGAVGMVRPPLALGEKKSSGCQFYIVTSDSHSRDGSFTVFGKVVSGLDVLEKISALELAPGTERPKNPPIITRVEVTP